MQQNTKENILCRGQALDIDLVDNELLKLLLPKIQMMFQYFHSIPVLRAINIDAINGVRENDISSIIIDNPSLLTGFNHLNEGQLQQRDHDHSSKYVTKIVLYLLKGVMIYSTIFHDLATPAMINLKATFKASTLPLSHQRIREYRNKLMRFLVLSTVIPLIYELIKWKRSDYKNQLYQLTLGGRIYNDANQNQAINQIRISDEQHRLALKRKLHTFEIILKMASFIVSPLELYAHISHLLSNTASPTLPMYLSGLQYSSLPLGRDQRSINYLYAQRRLWYEEMILTCGMVIPLEIWREAPTTIRLFLKR